jgi:hypothetical protein
MQKVTDKINHFNSLLWNEEKILILYWIEKWNKWKEFFQIEKRKFIQNIFSVFVDNLFMKTKKNVLQREKNVLKLHLTLTSIIVLASRLDKTLHNCFSFLSYRLTAIWHYTRRRSQICFQSKIRFLIRNFPISRWKQWNFYRRIVKV